mmetsp:Transcript_56676/g.130161  ORF Transcript_56676/g.130161 Transcript_56676/m.130161 type:complete len:212 (-) Transcript_56676:1435-2070(-)
MALPPPRSCCPSEAASLSCRAPPSQFTRLLRSATLSLACSRLFPPCTRTRPAVLPPSPCRGPSRPMATRQRLQRAAALAYSRPRCSLPLSFCAMAAASSRCCRWAALLCTPGGVGCRHLRRALLRRLSTPRNSSGCFGRSTPLSRRRLRRVRTRRWLSMWSWRRRSLTRSSTWLPLRCSRAKVEDGWLLCPTRAPLVAPSIYARRCAAPLL